MTRSSVALKLYEDRLGAIRRDRCLGRAAAPTTRTDTRSRALLLGGKAVA